MRFEPSMSVGQEIALKADTIKTDAHKLTAHQRQVLGAVQDWKACFEVVALIYPKPFTCRNGHVRSMAVWRTLEKLRDEYLVRYAADNRTYRATPRGVLVYNAAMRRGLK